MYTEIQEYFLTEFPEKVKLLRLYENPDFPLCKLYSTETALEKALKEFVWLKNGGYLIIQPTEALTVIDVNSGKMAVKSKNSAGAMKVNMEAAQEAAKQIRLRNLSGIIIVDFVNLESKEDTGILLKEFRNFLSKDPIPTTLVDMTMLGLVEITRKKVRKNGRRIWKLFSKAEIESAIIFYRKSAENCAYKNFSHYSHGKRNGSINGGENAPQGVSFGGKKIEKSSKIREKFSGKCRSVQKGRSDHYSR